MRKKNPDFVTKKSPPTRSKNKSTRDITLRVVSKNERREKKRGEKPEGIRRKVLIEGKEHGSRV